MSSYSDFPEVDVVDPTDSQGYGSDTLSELFKILNGKILDSRRPHVLNPWKFEGPITLQQQPAVIDPAIYTTSTAGEALLYIDSVSGKLTLKKYGGSIIDLETSIGLLQDLSNVNITSVANNDIIRYNSATGKWVNMALSGAGEANTASNVGTLGTGWFKQKTGVNLEFKKINAASTKITVTDDTANSKVDVDVAQANLDRNSIGGASPLSVANGGTGASTLTGVLKGNGTGAVTASAQLAVASGGTGAATLTGILKGNGTSAITAASPVVVADGGTGATTLTGVLLGNGTSAVTAISVGSSGNVLTNVGGTPQFQPPTSGTSTMQTAKKDGTWNGTGATNGAGLLNGIMVAGSGTFTQNVDTTTNGTYLTCATGSTSGNTAAIRSSYNFTAANLNPILYLRLREADITSNRLWVGFSSSVTADPVNSTYLDNKSGAMLYLAQSGTVWNVATNNGGATATITSTGVTASNNGIVSIIIKLIGATPKVSYSINGAAFVDITTTPPAGATTLGLNCGTGTTTSSSRSFDFFKMDITQDG